MERRRDVRVTLDQPVRVTALGTGIPPINGKAVELSGRGIRIVAPAEISPGTLVKIDLEDALMLGETCYCLPQSGTFMVGIEIDQALNGLASLARLNEALFGESGGGTPAREPALSYSMSEQQ